MIDDVGTQVAGYVVGGGVGAFTLAVLRLAYGSMRERTGDLKDRIHDLEADRNYWRDKSVNRRDNDTR